MGAQTYCSWPFPAFMWRCSHRSSFDIFNDPFHRSSAAGEEVRASPLWLDGFRRSQFLWPMKWLGAKQRSQHAIEVLVLEATQVRSPVSGRFSGLATPTEGVRVPTDMPTTSSRSGRQAGASSVGRWPARRPSPPRALRPQHLSRRCRCRRMWHLQRMGTQT